MPSCGQQAALCERNGERSAALSGSENSARMDEKYFMRTAEVPYALGDQYDNEPGRQGRHQTAYGKSD